MSKIFLKYILGVGLVGDYKYYNMFTRKTIFQNESTHSFEEATGNMIKIVLCSVFLLRSHSTLGGTEILTRRIA